MEDVDAALELNDEYEGWHILRGSICYVSGPRNYVILHIVLSAVLCILLHPSTGRSVICSENTVC